MVCLFNVWRFFSPNRINLKVEGIGALRICCSIPMPTKNSLGLGESCGYLGFRAWGLGFRDPKP